MYRVTGRLGDDGAAEAVRWLSADERARHDRFVFARDRRDFAAAHALLRRTLSAHGPHAPHEWRFDTGEHGKPALPPSLAGDPPLVFNLSHTHGLVACVVSRGGDAGIDVETIDRVVSTRAIARRYFSPPELAALEACDPSRQQSRFIELWTLKESYLKAVGTGLTHPLNTFAFHFDPDGAIAFEPPDGVDAIGWQFELQAPSPRHRLAVALRTDNAVQRPIVTTRHG